MNKIITFLCLLLFFSGPAYAGDTTLGKGVHLEQRTAVSAIIDSPETYIGIKVKIEGMILEVCAKRGCWIYVASDREGEKIQIKVTDGEIVFPMSSSGKMATVEGIVEELQLSKEDKIKYLKHLAEEKGQPFDPSTIKNERMIRIIGLGAVIQS